MSASAAVWIGALLSLAAYSFLILQDNVAFGFSEHLVVGCAAGYQIVIAIDNLKTLAIQPIAKGQTLVVIPVILGLLLFMKYVPKAVWVSRIPVSLLVGLASGVAVRGAIQSQILDQIRATMVTPNNVSNVILILGVIACLWYFFMTLQPGGNAGQWLSRVGRWVMMAAFGAGFGSTVTGRFSILIGHFQFLLHTWLGIR
jgi:hypothetical protein